MSRSHIAHLDMDSFFVSVERVLDPRLVGRTVVVGADPAGRGVVCAASYEARAFGVHAAMPIGRARQRLPAETVWLRPKMDAYTLYSRAVRTFLEERLPVVRQASIDEFDLDWSGCERLFGNLLEHGRGLQEELRTELGLPSSFGLATNRLMAKVAAGAAKPAGALEIAPGEEARFLAPLPVERLPGVGATTRRRLVDLGVRTIGDLARLSRQTLQTALGAGGAVLSERSRGRESAPPACWGEEVQRSVSREMTFARDTENPARLRRHLSELVESVCHDLRRLETRARTITLRLRYADFVTRARSRTIAPTVLDQEVFRTTGELLDHLLGRRVRVRLLGVRLSNLIPSGGGFLDFDDRWNRWERTLAAADRVVMRHGPRALRFARSIVSVEDLDLGLFLPPSGGGDPSG